MAVIINEFEADLEPQRQREAEPGAETAATGEPPTPSISPMDLDDLLRQRLERLARLVAD